MKKIAIIIFIGLINSFSIKAQHAANKVNLSDKEPVSVVQNISLPKPITDEWFLYYLLAEYPTCIDSGGNLLPPAAKLEKLFIAGSMISGVKSLEDI